MTYNSNPFSHTAIIQNWTVEIRESWFCRDLELWTQFVTCSGGRIIGGKSRLHSSPTLPCSCPWKAVTPYQASLKEQLSSFAFRNLPCTRSSFKRGRTQTRERHPRDLSNEKEHRVTCPCWEAAITHRDQ